MIIVSVLHIKHFSGAPSSQAAALSLPGPSRATSVSKVLAPSMSSAPKSAPMRKRAPVARVEALYDADARRFYECVPSASTPHLREEGHKRPQVPQYAMPEAVPAAASVGAGSGPLPSAEHLNTPS